MLLLLVTNQTAFFGHSFQKIIEKFVSQLKNLLPLRRPAPLAQGARREPMPSPGEKVARRSRVGRGMRAVSFRAVQGLGLGMSYLSAGLMPLPHIGVSPAFLFSQRLVPRTLTASPRGKPRALPRRWILRGGLPRRFAPRNDAVVGGMCL